jgi:predicted regulator of amino acid metabolism with ACT domain
MENVKAKNLRVATAKIAKATGFSRKVIRTAIKRSKEEQALRKQILSGIRVGKMDLNSSYLTFDGLLQTFMLRHITKPSCGP